MKSSSTRQLPHTTAATKEPQPRRTGGGYKLGPRAVKLPPPDARWITSTQVRNRYGGKSAMWLWRKLRDENDPPCPKPRYHGRIMMFSVAELDNYDSKLLSTKVDTVKKFSVAPSH